MYQDHELQPIGRSAPSPAVNSPGRATSPRQGSNQPTIIRGPPKPISVPASKREADLQRSELLMLKEICPQLDAGVLLEILRGNEWALDRSTDAALALSASLSAEAGTAVLGATRLTSRAADVDEGASSSSTSIEAPQSNSTSRSRGKQTPTRDRRGMPVLLPETFLAVPRYRLVVDRFDAAKTDFSITFRRRNEKLGITIQEIDAEICIHTLHSRSSGQPLLALEAGVKVGDILTGIDSEFFSPGAEVQDVIDMLHLSGSFVTLHFTRRHRPDDAAQSRVHRCAQMLVDQTVIQPDRAMYVSNSLRRLKERVLGWDSGWISQRILAWRLDQGLQMQRGSGSSDRLSLGAGGGGAARRSIDIGVPTRDLRPALSVRLLRARERQDHVAYVVWVLDVRSGVEWVLERRFREFYDFRDLLVSIRPGISSIEFPPKRFSVAETALITAERLYLFQRFLRRVSSLVCVNSLHPSTARLQIALQNFLEVGDPERLERMVRLEAAFSPSSSSSSSSSSSPSTSPPSSASSSSPHARSEQQRAIVQVFVHNVLQMACFDKVFSGFIDNFEDAGEDDTKKSWDPESGRAVLFGFRDFVDNLQNVLFDGLSEDCLEVAKRCRGGATEDVAPAQSSPPTPSPSAAAAAAAAAEAEAEAEAEQPSVSISKSGSGDGDDESSVDSIGRGCLQVSMSSDGHEDGDVEAGGEGHRNPPHQSQQQQQYHHYQQQSAAIKLQEDELRILIRGCVRRQVEVELYVACAARIRLVLERSFACAETDLQRKMSALEHQPQSFYGVTIDSLSPSSWESVVVMVQQLRALTLPHDRLAALVSAAKAVPSLFMLEHPEATRPLGADEFLPIFIYILVRACRSSHPTQPALTNLLALNEEMQALCDPDLRMSESGYYLATLEAALQHLAEADPREGVLIRRSQSHDEEASNCGED